MKFKDKIVIVTGGALGIGRSISQTFAMEGATVVIADNNIEAGVENQQFINEAVGKAFFVYADVAIEDSVKNLTSITEFKYGRIDILINNAGISDANAMGNSSTEIWDRVLAVNLKGTFLCSKYCSDVMIKSGGGSIINIASTRAFMSEPHTEAYSASKGGIIALTHSLAVSLGDKKIRVNSISPGWIDVSAWKTNKDSIPAVLSPQDHSQHPAGRVGKPEDISAACAFLCSDDAGFITGTNLIVDGGMTIKMIYV